MTKVLQFLGNHGYAIGAIATYIATAFYGAMPKPDETWNTYSVFYKFFGTMLNRSHTPQPK